jgi:proteasome lid subunit RPN8/RPN11
MGRSHPNLLPLLSNVDTTSSSLESTRGSQAPRYTWIYGCFYKIWGTRAREWSNFTKDGGTIA